MEFVQGQVLSDRLADRPSLGPYGMLDYAQSSSYDNQQGLIVLEDAAHAHGAQLKSRKIGTWGRMSIFSFQKTKPLPAIEGGMGMYKEKTDCERATTFGHYSLPKDFPDDSSYRRYQGTGLGAKFRMHPMAAALAGTRVDGSALVEERV